jgi:hypothetical protein
MILQLPGSSRHSSPHGSLFWDVGNAVLSAAGVSSAALSRAGAVDRKKAAFQAAALSALQQCLEKLPPGEHLQQVSGPLLAIVQRHWEVDAAVTAPKVHGQAV